MNEKEKLLEKFHLRLRVIGDEYISGKISYNEYLAKCKIEIVETAKKFELTVRDETKK